MARSIRPALAVPAVSLALAALVGGAGASLPTAAAATQSGATSLTAPIVQQGKTPGALSDARLAGQVTFKPALKGRPVAIQRQVPGGAWKTVANGVESRTGVVRFTAAPTTADGQAYTFRG